MLVLNDPVAKVSGDAASAAPVANLSAFASSNNLVVKVRHTSFFCLDCVASSMSGDRISVELINEGLCKVSVSRFNSLALIGGDGARHLVFTIVPCSVVFFAKLAPC